MLPPMQANSYLDRQLTGEILDAAIEVHRALGPGLLESAYATCLQHEFDLRQIAYEREFPVALQYKKLDIPFANRADFVVARKVVVEVKSIDSLQPVHTAQLLTYMRLADVRLGLLINFNTYALRNGVKRLIR